MVLAHTIGFDDAARALPLVEEAVEKLLPDFVRHPKSFASLMKAVVRDYLNVCESANQTPEQSLLESILPHFTTEGLPNA